MGLSRLSGPVYGAKATLVCVGPFACSTGSSAVFSGGKVPSGEDWYATELVLHRASTGSTDLAISLQVNSTTVGSVTIGGSSVVASNISILTTDGGEYEGTRIASGTTFTLSHSSHAGPNIGCTVTLRGFTRFVNSTRAE